MGFYEDIIERIAADVDPAAVIEDIRIYTNWVLVKTGKWSLSTYFHNMPGFTDPIGMDTWMGDWIGRPARAAALELLASPRTPGQPGDSQAQCRNGMPQVSPSRTFFDD